MVKKPPTCSSSPQASTIACSISSFSLALLSEGRLIPDSPFSFRRCRTAGRLLRFYEVPVAWYSSEWLAAGRLLAKQLPSHPTIPFPD